MARKKQLVHFAIQGANIFGKFLLMMGLARFLNLSELGLYATTVAAFGILQPLINLQFGRYTYRHCASAEPEQVVTYVRHYMGLLAAMLCIGAPIMAYYASTILESSHIAWIVALLVCNLLAMEVSNLLMVRQYSTRYLVAVFVGQSAWIYILLSLWVLDIRIPSLLDVWRFWTCSAFLSLCISMLVVRGYPWFRIRWVFLRDWFINGLKLSPVNLTVLACSIGVLNSTIFFVQHYHGLEAAGIYGLFFAVVLGIRQWVMGGAYVVQEPKLFRCHDASDKEGFRKETFVMFRDSLIAYGIASVIAIPGIYLVLAISGESIPESAMLLYWGFIITACAVLICDLGQVVGFARHLWKRLALLNIIVLSCHVALCLWLLPQLDYRYAFVPLLISSLLRMLLYARYFRIS